MLAAAAWRHFDDRETVSSAVVEVLWSAALRTGAAPQPLRSAATGGLVAFAIPTSSGWLLEQLVGPQPTYTLAHALDPAVYRDPPVLPPPAPPAEHPSTESPGGFP